MLWTRPQTPPKPNRPKQQVGGQLPGLTVATCENYLLVSFKVTLSPTHTPVPYAEKKVKPIKTEHPSVSRLDLTRDNKCQEQPGAWGAALERLRGVSTLQR